MVVSPFFVGILCPCNNGATQLQENGGEMGTQRRSIVPSGGPG